MSHNFLNYADVKAGHITITWNSQDLSGGITVSMSLKRGSRDGAPRAKPPPEAESLLALIRRPVEAANLPYSLYFAHACISNSMLELSSVESLGFEPAPTPP